MAYKSLFDGILFVEGFEENIQVLGPVEYKKDLSSKKVMFKLLDSDLVGVKNISELLDKDIYVCQEV